MSASPATFRDSKLSLQAMLVLDGFVRLLIWSSAMTAALLTITWLDAWPTYGIMGAGLRETWEWCQRFTHIILLFNLYYVAALVVLRLPIPTPREGEYSMASGQPLDRQLLYSAFIAVLTKARYHAPFPGFLVFHIANLPPLRFFMMRIFGPHSKSCHVLDPVLGDPHLTQIGRNVVFGYNAAVSCHTQQRDSVSIKRVAIGDNVLIGANAVIFSGCTIGNGAVILSGAVVAPNTVIGDNEVWGGLPAKKIKTMLPEGAA